MPTVMDCSNCKAETDAKVLFRENNIIITCLNCKKERIYFPEGVYNG